MLQGSVELSSNSADLALWGVIQDEHDKALVRGIMHPERSRSFFSFLAGSGAPPSAAAGGRLARRRSAVWGPTRHRGASFGRGVTSGRMSSQEGRGVSPWTVARDPLLPPQAPCWRVQAASAMPTALTIIRVLKWLSTLALVLTAAAGAALLDRRFTMLMLPPFFMHAAPSKASAEGQPADLG